MKKMRNEISGIRIPVARKPTSVHRPKKGKGSYRRKGRMKKVFLDFE